MRRGIAITILALSGCVSIRMRVDPGRMKVIE